MHAWIIRTYCHSKRWKRARCGSHSRLSEKTACVCGPWCVQTVKSARLVGKTVLSRGRHRVWAKDYSLVFCKWNRAWDCIEGGAKLTNIVEIFIDEYCPGHLILRNIWQSFFVRNLSINIVDCSQHYLWCSTIPEKDYESVSILGKATMDHHIYCRINIGDHIWSAIWKDDFWKDWISSWGCCNSYHLRTCIYNESIRERFLIGSSHTSNIKIPEDRCWTRGIINKTQRSAH